MQLIEEYPNTAAECRALGLVVGDTIEGTEGDTTWWNKARLTLLWLGEEVAVFRVTTKTQRSTTWSSPRESANWSLRHRYWNKINIKDSK